MCLVCFRVSSARSVMSPRFPIGVPTRYSFPATRAWLRSRSTANADGVAHGAAQVLAQLSHQARFELAHALARHAEAVAQLLQRERFVGHDALVEDVYVLAAQRLSERFELALQ